MIQKEAKLQDREALTSLVSNKVTTLTLHDGRKVKVGYILGVTQDKIDELIVQYDGFKKSIKPKDGEEYSERDLMRGNKYTRQFYSQCVAAILLNSYWGIRLFWGLKWRLMYYFGKWSGEDYLQVISEAKKKAAEQEYSLGMVFLMDMTTTWTTMTKKEAEEYRQELQLAREAQLLKSSQV